MCMSGYTIFSRSVFRGGVLFGLLALRCAVADGSASQQIASDAGLSVSVSPDGAYRVTDPGHGWTFGGNIGRPARNIALSNGTDGVGTWVEIAFDYDPVRSSAIRLYNDSPVVLFTTKYGLAGPNADAFPHFITYPRDLSTFSFNGLWDFAFGYLNSRSPLLLYDAQAHAFMFSPASNFMTAQSQLTSDGGIEAAIDGRIAALPAGFTHRAVLAFGTGINSTFDTWGQTLTGLSGKLRPTNDSVTLLNKLSYWTDAGTAYYYHPQDGTQIVPTLQKIPAQFAQMSVPIGSMELDSWYYPKGSPPLWYQNGSGMDTFQADASVFPKGLAMFQQSLGVPLITHARWIDEKSPLRNSYKISGNVAIDPQYWQNYAQYLVDNNVELLEQDWLSDKAQTDFNLTDPYLFLDNMASKMAAAGRKLMYCMPLWGDFLQSTNYDNVVAVRVSNDAFVRDRWDAMLFVSRLASATGLWPFADALSSNSVKDVLLSTLTAGPLASGDPLGTANAANLRQAVRVDGVIVKPDVPIVPVDATYVAVSRDKTAPIVASTYTDHGGLKTAYVFAYERTNGSLGAIAFSPESVGVAGPAYVYNYFLAKGGVVSAGAQFTDTVDYNGSYYVVAPVGPSGLAFLGDSGKFVSVGKKRVATLSDDGTLRVSLQFAPAETSVVLHLYSAVKPAVVAATGSVARVESEGKDLYRVVVAPDSSGNASLSFWQLHAVQQPAHPRR
jgi:hypothetical protein